jgi:hypothetical protein
VRDVRQLVRMPLRREGATRGGVRKRELEELRRRIEELENRRNEEAELDYEFEEEIEVEQNVEERDPSTCLISFLSNRGSMRVEVSCYDGSLKAANLIDWIGELETYFKYENVQDPNCVHFTITKLKGHVALWWDMLHKYRVDHIVEKIKTWKKMVSKIKDKFLPVQGVQKISYPLK